MILLKNSEAALAGAASSAEYNDGFQKNNTSSTTFRIEDFDNTNNNSGDKFLGASERSKKVREEHKERNASFPLQREVDPAKPFPFDALGPILGPVSKRVFEVVKSPDSICGQSFLCAAALITQPYANIHIDGRKHPLSLFALAVGESGDRKSAVDNIALQSVRKYEKMLIQAYNQENRVYKNKIDAWKKRREILINGAKPDKLEECLGSFDSEPMPPLEPHLLIEEPTYEGLVKLFAIGQPSIGLFSDDGGRMLGGHAMGKDNILKTITGLSCLWDGNKPITRIRGGDENLLLYGRRLSMHLMIQDVVLSSLLKNEILMGQGLLARCLIVAPPTNAGYRSYVSEDISMDPLVIDFWKRTGTLLDYPCHLVNAATKNELTPRPIILSPQAKARWVLFHDETDRAMRPDGLYRAIRRTANKSAEQVLRIAGVLTLIENIEASSISLETIEMSIKLVQFYLNEALRINEMGFNDPDLELASALLHWMTKKLIKEGSDRSFPLQEIYQCGGPRGIRKKKEALKILGILEDHRTICRPDKGVDVWKICKTY